MNFLPSTQDLDGVKRGVSKYGTPIKNANDPDLYAQLKQVKGEVEKLEKSGEDKPRLEKLKVTQAGLEKAIKESDTKENEAPEFSSEIRHLAEKNGKSEAEVRALWKKYTQDCQNYDKSPVLSEFCQWNHLKNESDGIENAMVHWKCPKCGNEATVSSVYDEKICMKDGCGTAMERQNEDSANLGFQSTQKTTTADRSKEKDNHEGTPIPFWSGAVPENNLTNTPDGTFTEPERLEYDNSLYTVLPQYETEPTLKNVQDPTVHEGVERGNKRYGKKQG